MPNSSLCFNISMLTCCQTLLAKSGVAPNKVLFVDDSAKNIQSVRRVVRCCAFFATLIVASYLPEFRCYRLVSPKQFPFSMWSFKGFTDGFPASRGLVARPLESVLFICQKGLQKQHGVIPWRCIELIRILPTSFQPNERLKNLPLLGDENFFASSEMDKETPGWRMLCWCKIQNPIDRAEFSQPALPFPGDKKTATAVGL